MSPQNVRGPHLNTQRSGYFLFDKMCKQPPFLKDSQWQQQASVSGLWMQDDQVPAPRLLGEQG